MKQLINRRGVLASAAALAILGAGPASAQTPFPSQPVRLVVPAPAGGATDVQARVLGQKLSEAWKVPVLVDNKPGAGGSIGANFVAKAPPDGHTILMTVPALIQQRTLMNLPYDPIKDFVPVALISKGSVMFVVRPDSPATNLKEFVALAKANPGKFNYGSFGAGTSSHIQGALLNLQAGLDMVHVPFPGGAPLVNNMVGGQLTSAFLDIASSRAHLKSFRPLAVTGTERLRILPDVPTFKELGYKDFESNSWFGLFLPNATPSAIVNKYAEEVNRILRMPDVTERIEGLGLTAGTGTPEAFARTVRTDSDLYARIIKATNVKISQ